MPSRIINNLVYLVPLLVLLLSNPFPALATRHYNIVNGCPFPIDLYINGVKQAESPLAAHGVGNATRDFPEGWSGFIYTDFNRGNALDGSGTVRAGFYGTSNYYYLVKDPTWLNVGVSIIPSIQSTGADAFCKNTTCEVNNCPLAFSQPPTAFPPPVAGTPPQSPLYECPHAGTGYAVTFCPAGVIPGYNPNTSRSIRPIASNTTCLDVRGAVFANGTPVQIYGCNGTPAQKWDIIRGEQHIRVTGTNFCLDAGSNPASGVGMKIWTCYDNLPAQEWIYDADNHIVLKNQGQCLDLTDGILTNSEQSQTWTCSTGNNNQVWVTI